MVPRVKDVKYVGDHKIWLAFEDGRQGEVDLKDELWGEVFEPLKSQETFEKIPLNPELNTVCWDTGADFAPEFLYAKLKGPPNLRKDEEPIS